MKRPIMGKFNAQSLLVAYQPFKLKYVVALLFTMICDVIGMRRRNDSEGDGKCPEAFDNILLYEGVYVIHDGGEVS